MEDFLIKLAAFIVAIGILITIHEYGHFRIARRLGVKVLKFSIGFGRTLWSWRAQDGIEYVIAAIPLGGYVKMADEREETVAPEDLPMAFNRKPLWVRTAVVVAGPLANLIFAVVALWAVAVIGEVKLRPIVGEVDPASIADQAGFQSGDIISSVNGQATNSWSRVLFELAANALSSDQPIRFEVKDQLGEEEIREIPPGLISDLADRNPFEVIGLRRAYLQLAIPPIIGEVVPGEAGDAAGLAVGDRIMRADDTEISTWYEWWKYVRERPEQRIDLIVSRQGQELSLSLTPRKIEHGGETIGRVGVASAPPSPGLMAKFQRFERFGPLEAIPYALWETTRLSGLVLQVMAKIVIGEASINNLSGPISIADTAGNTVKLGLVPFLMLLAMISISLGVLNLLPIPVLDGGHLAFFAYEAIVGKPPSTRALITSQRIGMALLLGIMALALYVDLSRHLG